MNANMQPDIAVARLLPANLEALAPPPALLPGESMQRYKFLRAAIFADLAPQSAIEWLLAIDVVELSWEIERYRLLRHKVLERYRQPAVERCLRDMDLIGIPPEHREVSNRHIRRNAIEWQSDPEAASEIEARMTANGFDELTTNAESHVQAREAFVLFQALLDAAQNRRSSSLREIRFQRLTTSSSLAERRR